MSCEENRRKVCGVCSRKGSLRYISDPVFKMIKDHHYPDYNFLQMPSTICAGCDRILRFIDKADLATKKEDAKRKLVPINYEDKKSPPPSVTTRATVGLKCDCFWCRVARLSGLEYLINAQSVCQPHKKSSPLKLRHVTKLERCHAVISKGTSAPRPTGIRTRRQWSRRSPLRVRRGTPPACLTHFARRRISTSRAEH